MTDWVPISDHLRSIREEGVLHEGVPPHLRASLAAWFRNQWTAAIDGVRHESGAEMLRRIERECQLPLDWYLGVESAAATIADLAEGSRAQQERYLDVVQCTLASMTPPPSAETGRITPAIVRVLNLKDILISAGSAWTAEVDGRTPSLQRRVLPEVADRYKRVVTVSGRASEHLREGWAACYGRDPKFDRSYARAVKAVEAVATPLFLPNDQMATLGKCIRALRDAPEKWRVTLAADVDRDGWPGGIHAVLRMMQALWDGQHDRHGDSDETKPGEVGPEETETALHIALTLVHLFRNGLVEPLPST